MAHRYKTWLMGTTNAKDKLASLKVTIYIITITIIIDNIDSVPGPGLETAHVSVYVVQTIRVAPEMNCRASGYWREIQK